jgi:hypothetical protein
MHIGWIHAWVHTQKSNPISGEKMTFSLLTSALRPLPTDFRPLTAAHRPPSTALRLLPSALCLLTSALCFPTSVFSQAPGYSREEVIARDSMVQQEGIVAQDRGGAGSGSMVGGNLLTSGPQSLGSSRSSVREKGGSQSAMLRFDQHRDVEPPAYATLRIGPLYSDIGISESVGVRYVRMEGSGVDFLTGNHRGEFLKDGVDFPIVTSVSLDNYMIISRHMDLEANITASYAHYPLETQEDEFIVNLTDEGIYGTLSSEYHPSRDTRLLFYDDILYRTDYVDSRGLDDRYGGEQYEHFDNTLGADWDWKPSAFDNFGVSASRQDVIPIDDEFETQERVAYSESISYQRELTRSSSAALYGSFSQSLYDSTNRPDIYRYGLHAFSSARLTRTLTGNALLGYQFSTYSGGSSDGESSGTLSGGFGLGHAISESKGQRVTYLRTQAEAFSGGIDVNDTLAYVFDWREGLFPGSLSTRYSAITPEDEDRNGYSDWATSLRLQHQLTRIIRLAFSTTYSVRSNDGVSEELVAEAPDINDDYETLSLRLGSSMRLTKKTNFSAYAEHVDRTSDNEDLAYTRDIIGAALTWSHKF